MIILIIGDVDYSSDNAAALRVLEVAKEFVAQGHEVDLFNSTRSQPKRDTIARYANIYQVARPSCLVEKFLFKLGMGFSLLYNEKIDKTAYDVVYCYGSALSWIVAGSVVRRKKHARFAVDVTELYGFEDIFKSISFFRSRWGTWIGMFIAIPLTASAIAVPSNYYLNIMRYFHRNVYLIPPFFGDLPETQIEREDGNRELTLVYAGSPSTKEQFSTLLLSLLRLHKDIDRPIRLKLVGFSDSQIDQMLVENGAEGLRQSSNVFIDVIGRTDVATARRIVRLSDFLIVIRRSSLRVNCGFPSKVAEAFCLGTPIITNKYSDINLYLKSGFNGFLIEKVDIQTVTETLLRCVSLDINDILSLEKGAHATGYTCFSSHAVRQRIMQFIS